jgi:hypothetical protein
VASARRRYSTLSDERFPYGIIYELSEDEIVIIAVAPLHREPEYWRSRVH